MKRIELQQMIQDRIAQEKAFIRMPAVKELFGHIGSNLEQSIDNGHCACFCVVFLASPYAEPSRKKITAKVLTGTPSILKFVDKFSLMAVEQIGKWRAQLEWLESLPIGLVRGKLECLSIQSSCELITDEHVYTESTVLKVQIMYMAAQCRKVQQLPYLWKNCVKLSNLI